jgi:hypothetical protein
MTSRCCVMSPECIQNVDNSQVPRSLRPQAHAAQVAPPPVAWQGTHEARRVIRLGPAAWRVAAKPQRIVIRRPLPPDSNGARTAKPTERSERRQPTAEETSPAVR